MLVYYVVAGRDVDISDPDCGSLSERDCEVLRRIGRMLEHRVGGLECPTHGEAPTAVVAGPSCQQLGLEIKGCCEQFVETVSQQLNPSERH